MSGAPKSFSILTFVFFILSTLSLLCLVIGESGSASVFLRDGTEVPPDQVMDTFMNKSVGREGSLIQIEFFHDHRCQSCQSAREYIRIFEKKNPDITVIQYNLGYPKENQSLFTQYKNQFNTTNIRYPAVFIGDMAISGGSDIIAYTEPLAKATLKKGLSTPEPSIPFSDSVFKK